MSKKEKDESFSRALQEDYNRWEILLVQGGQDPFWSDGYNMNLVRNHILSDKSKLEEHLSEELFPKEYYRPLPAVMPESYFARNRGIWYGALKSYQIYLENEDYKYLCSIRDSISKEIRKESHIDAVIGYVDGLKHMLEEKDFTGIRRHEKASGYLESFRECRTKIGELLFREQGISRESQKAEQLDLFHMGLNQEGKRR